MNLLKLPQRVFFLIKKPANERDAIIYANVIKSLLFQFLTNVLGLLVVPLSLGYIDKEKYGIWINASVMVTWLQNMNFGMGFGMQNKVAEAMAHDETERAKDYVTIAYRYSTLIAAGILAAGLLAGFFINWNKLFNSSISPVELKVITFIAFVCFLVYFVLGNIVPVFSALKQTALPKLIGLYTNVITIVFLFGISRFSHNSLIWAALALALPTPLIYLVSNIYYYQTRAFRGLKPRWRIQNKGHVKDVFSLGVKFFIMQLTTLVMTQSGVFIITQYLGPAEVTPYSIINRYFYFAYFIFSLAITPYWSGFTEAYVKKDYVWIRQSLKKLFFLGMGGAAVVLVMLACSFRLIPIWSKHSFDIHQYHSLLYSGALYIISLFFASIISTFLNGISKLNYQLIVQVLIAVLTIIISIVLIARYHLGSTAVNVTALIGQIIYLSLCGFYAYRFVKNLQHAAPLSAKDL